MIDDSVHTPGCLPLTSKAVWAACTYTSGVTASVAAEVGSIMFPCIFEETL